MRRYHVGILAGALVAIMAGASSAQVTTERSGSILVFPKVVADGTRDTIIQITNTSNSMVHAHCFYVNAAPVRRDLPPDPILNPPQWQELDFDIWLTKQQPTHFVVSRGRPVNPQDPPCDRLVGNYDCPDSGIDPGRVPPVPDDFVGELKCIEVDASGAPVSGNHFKGEATIITSDVCGPHGFCANDDSRCMTDNDCTEGAPCNTGILSCELSPTDCTDSSECNASISDEAKYNAIAIIGNENNDGDPVLCLGGEPSDACLNGAEYDACPETWIVNHEAYGAEDLLLGPDSFVATNLTIVPCEQNYETQDPESVTLQLLTYNEFEQVFSSSTALTCWADLKLIDINNLFLRSTLASDFAQTRIRPSGGTQSGILLVATETHYIGDTMDASVGQAAPAAMSRPYPPYATASFNAHVEGARIPQDLITIPAEQIQ